MSKIIKVAPPIAIPIFLNTPIISCNVSIYYLLPLGNNALKFLAVLPAEFIILPLGLTKYFDNNSIIAEDLSNGKKFNIN